MDNTSIQLFQGAAGAVGLTTSYVDDYFSARAYVGNGYSKRLLNTRVDFSADNAGASSEFNMSCNTEGSYYQFPASADWAWEGDFSLEFWAYSNKNQEQPLLTWDTGAYKALFWNGSDNWRLQWPTGSSNINMGGTQPEGGAWRHNLITRSGSTIRFFQDGALVSTHTTSDTIGENSIMYVGYKGNTTGVWLGNVSNLRIIKGSIPTDYQTSSTTAGASIYSVPTENLTTTSQGATANDVKLLGLQSTVESNAWVKTSTTPEMVGAKGGPRWSSNGPFTVTEDVSEGGMIWFKCRSDSGYYSYTFNTVSGTGVGLRTASTGAPNTGDEHITNFNAQGVTLNSAGNEAQINGAGRTYIAWSFRKKKNFFDVVSWTGNTDTSQVVSHGLGSTPGFIVCRRTNGAGTWFTYHRGVTDPSISHMRLNATSNAATNGSSQSWNPTGSSFTAPGSLSLNDNGDTYVAYLFAHDAGGFGVDADESVIKCGAYTASGNAGQVIDLGWEPQFLMIKDADGSGGWLMTDDTRGMDTFGIECLYANTTADEASNNDKFSLTTTGFILGPSDGDVNSSGNNFIYIAIRRPDTKVSSTPQYPVQVFGLRGSGGVGANNFTGSARNEFKTDWFYEQYYNKQGGGGTAWQLSRPSNAYMYFNSTGPEADFGYDLMDSWFGVQYGNRSQDYQTYNWKRWKGFDVIKWVGSSTVPTMVTHHMGNTPEMIWAKKKTTGNWFCWHKDLDSGGFGKYLKINGTDAVASSGGLFHSATATQIGFNGSSDINVDGQAVLSLAFASVSGVSKVGSYTGSSGVKSLDFGFTPKYILIKRTDATGDWMQWDTKRGIVAGAADWGEYVYTHENNSQQSVNWTAPSGVTRISAVIVGGGGGGRAYNASSGTHSYATFNSSFYMQASRGIEGYGNGSGSRSPGGGYSHSNTSALSGGTYGGGNGGDGGYGSGNASGGAGGAGGYAGNGGQGANLSGAGQAGAGGGGAGGGGGGGHGNPGGGGGGVGIYGQGADGTSSSGGGSGGSNGSTSRPPTGNIGGGGFGYYGAGGGSGAGLVWANNIPVTPGNNYTLTIGAGGQQWDNQSVWLRTGGNGAVRIIWGTGRSYPTNAGDNNDIAMHLNNSNFDNFNFMATTSTGVDLVAGQSLINVNGGSYIYYAHA